MLFNASQKEKKKKKKRLHKCTPGHIFDMYNPFKYDFRINTESILFWLIPCVLQHMSRSFQGHSDAWTPDL